MNSHPTTCAYHCRACGSHFTSLEAFDGHREGPAGGNRICSFPESAELVELSGSCRVSHPTLPLVAVTIYEHAKAGRLREYRKAENAREALSTDAKSATAA
jgi:hypothetical protein